ncbi:hypothetical protein L8R18_01965 [Enterobacter kobei]|uniref:hypothetical protein n=1 Tax=Enterobacter kobei TaxID=208224 RepID=UPI002005BD66|nr:hypothetical protein [Enterobacter kobei]MCK6867346.1 hypothetical protein [Enterobacter kobei]
MNKSNEMFKITNARKVTLNNNATTGDTILNADNVDIIEGTGNVAGKANSIKTKKPNHLKKALYILFMYILIPLLVIFIAFKLGWN